VVVAASPVVVTAAAAVVVAAGASSQKLKSVFQAHRPTHWVESMIAKHGAGVV
jgi:hypothetical protein